MATTATLGQIRSGLVANLSDLGIQSKGFMLAAPTAPTIEVFPGETEYDEAMQRGLDQVTVTVRITVSVAIDVPAQQRLDEYLEPSGATSVKRLIESDKTLGGVVKDLHVTQASGYEVSETKDGGIALSCSWTVVVWA